MWDEPSIAKPSSLPRSLYEELIAKFLVRQAHVHFAATKTLVLELAKRFRIRAEYAPHATYLAEMPKTISPYTSPTAVYLGNLYSLWDHDIIFEAARHLARRGKRPAIAIIGSGPEELKWKRFVAEHQLYNIQMLGRKTGVDLWSHLSHAHVLLFPIRNNLSNLTRCPSKTYAYAQTKRPIITCPVGEVAELLGDKASYVDANALSFALAIERSLQAETQNEIDYNLEAHTWDVRADSLLRRLEEDSSTQTWVTGPKNV
jgi:glycosyltransferase involved in cell wall biosynthesis